MSTEWLTQKNEPGSGFHLLSKILVRKGESTWSCHCVTTTILLQASWCVVHQVRCPPRYTNRSKIAIPFLRLHFYRFSFLLHNISCKGPKHAAELTITTVQLYQLLIFESTAFIPHFRLLIPTIESIEWKMQKRGQGDMPKKCPVNIAD